MEKRKNIEKKKRSRKLRAKAIRENRKYVEVIQTMNTFIPSMAKKI